MLPVEAPYSAAGLAQTALNAVYAAQANRAAAGRSFTCSRCLIVSHSPADAANGYCGACHAFTGAPPGP